LLKNSFCANFQDHIRNTSKYFKKMSKLGAPKIVVLLRIYFDYKFLI